MFSPHTTVRFPLASSALLTSLVLLSSCTIPFLPQQTVPAQNASASSSSVEIEETPNITYQGVLTTVAISTDGRANYVLTLENGTIVHVESLLDLQAYDTRRVEVLGAIRPLGNGEISMRVERITALELRSSSAASSMSSMISSSSSAVVSSEFPSSKQKERASTAAVSSAIPVAPSSRAVPPSPPPVPPVSSAPPYQASDELTEKADIMAKAKTDASMWTQTFCTKIAKICIPMHKYWYYNAFNGTQRSLWHMEIGPTPVNALGDGPIVIDLFSGTTQFDNTVTVDGSSVIGYRNTPDDRHVEITAPASLQASVTIMVTGIAPQ